MSLTGSRNNNQVFHGSCHFWVWFMLFDLRIVPQAYTNVDLEVNRVVRHGIFSIFRHVELGWFVLRSCRKSLFFFGGGYNCLEATQSSQKKCR